MTQNPITIHRGPWSVVLDPTHFMVRMGLSLTNPEFDWIGAALDLVDDTRAEHPDWTLQQTLAHINDSGSWAFLTHADLKGE